MNRSQTLTDINNRMEIYNLFMRAAKKMRAEKMHAEKKRAEKMRVR